MSLVKGLNMHSTLKCRIGGHIRGRSGLLEAALRCQLGLSGLGGGAFPLHLALLLLLLGVLALSVHRCRRKRQLCLQNFKGIVRGQCEGQSTI